MRKINIFEKLLLPVGIFIALFGLLLFLQADMIAQEIRWLKLIAIFNWMILLFIIIMTAANEDTKEQLIAIQHDHLTEIQLLNELNEHQLEELKMLRKKLK